MSSWLAGRAIKSASVIRDLRFAWRSLRRAPGFSLVAVATLALAFALTAAVTAIVNAYLFRSFPYPESDRLYHVRYAPVGQAEPRGLSGLDWDTLRDVIELADDSAPTRLYVADGGVTREVMGLLTAPGSLAALGVRVVSGRSLVEADFAPAGERVALIGHAMWQERFGGDPQIIGQLLRAARAADSAGVESYRIVGVLPPDFRYVREYQRGAVEVMLPLRSPLRPYMVRLRDGVPPEDAEHRITQVVRTVASTLPAAWSGVRLESVHEHHVAALRPLLLSVSAATVLVLLIVSGNLAVLVLLRTLRRQREIGIRVSLGAGRAHILRMLLAEIGLICGGAVAAGAALFAIGQRALAPFVETHMGRAIPGGPSALNMDVFVLMCVGGAAAAVALSLSCIPMLAPWQRRLADALRSGSRTDTDTRSIHRLRTSLIALEVAGSVALLAGGGLMIRTVFNLVRTDLGFQAEELVRMRMALPVRAYPDVTSFLRFYDRLSGELGSQFGMAFALANYPPFVELPLQELDIDGERSAPRVAGVLAVSEAYFHTLRVGIIRGRAFGPADRSGSEPVAIVSDTLARRHWPDGDAMGRRIRTPEQHVSGAPLTAWRTIVGIARDVRQTHTDRDLADVYIPFLQTPGRHVQLYGRTDRPLTEWRDSVRAAVADIDPDVLIADPMSMRDQAHRLLAGPRFLMTLLTIAAGFAGSLAMLGIYGVTAFAVQQRRRELAIRIALGATRTNVLRVLLREAAAALAVGLPVGMLAGIGVANLLANQLHGVRTDDAATLVATAIAMTAGALLAGWWPARQADRVDPAGALNEP